MMRGRVGRLLLSTLRIALLTVSLLIVVGVVVRYTMFDRYLIYFPEKEVHQDPGDAGMVFDDVTFAASDGTRLHGWFVPAHSDVTLLWFHGNAGNIAHRVQNVAELHTYLGVNVFIFDYRGYGRSEGKPSEEGTYKDAEGAVAYLRGRADVEQDKIVYFGRSLGCGVAIELALKEPARAMICESPFTSIQAMAKRTYPWLPGIGVFARTKYDSISKIGDIRVPLLVLHGNADRIVPIELGRELYDAANDPKRFYEIDGADHNDTFYVGGRPYYDALQAFLEEFGEGA